MTHESSSQADGYGGHTLSERVIDALRDAFSVPSYEDVDTRTRLHDVCGVGCYGAEERGDLRAVLFDDFGVSVPDVVAARWTTVQDVIDHLVAHRAIAEQIGG